MNLQQEQIRQGLESVAIRLVDVHFVNGSEVAPPSLYAEQLVIDLCQKLAARVHAWYGARDTGPGMLADCVLMMLPVLHRELCPKSRVRHCEHDIGFAADLVAIVALWIFECPIIRPPVALIQDALRSIDPAIRRDRMEVAFGQALAPETAAVRALPSVTEGTPNLQVNAPVSRVRDERYLETRRVAKFIEFALTNEPLNVEVTSDYAHPTSEARSPLDELVDGAIYRTACMIVFTKGGKRGTGETLRLAATLAMPVLILRLPSTKPLEARRDHNLSIRVERTYRTPEEALDHVRDFLTRYRPQIMARQAELVAFAGRTAGLDRVHEAVLALDAAVFETSRITRAAAIFFTSDPIYWFQAGDAVRNEVRRLISPPSARIGDAGQVGSMLGPTDAALRRERRSTENLMSLAEISGWSYGVVVRLMQEHARREARASGARSHESKPMQIGDWEALYREVFGS